MSQFKYSGSMTKYLKRLMDYMVSNGLDPDFSNYDRIGVISSDDIDKNLESLSLAVAAGYITVDDLRDDKSLEYRSFCHCGAEDLVENCIVKHRDRKYFFIVGSRCYKRFTIKEDRLFPCAYPGCSNKCGVRKFTVCVNHPASERERFRVGAKPDSVLDRELKKRERAMELKRVYELKLHEKRKKDLARAGERIFEFGKRYRGHRYKDIPADYVEWLRSNNVKYMQALSLIRWFDASIVC